MSARYALLIVPVAMVAFATAPETLEDLAKASLATIDGRVQLPGLRDSVEIIRDRWGVPHIYARNTDDLFFAQGFVQAQDRLWQMEMYRRQYEGTLAEVMGPSYARHDEMTRLLRFRAIDDREWTHYHPEGRRIFQAFANGVNAFIAQSGDRLPVEFRLTGLKPQPWTPEVALLRTQTAMPVGDATAELRLARDVVRLGVDSANKAARPSPYRDLVPAAGVDLALIGDQVVNALGGIRGGVVRPALLPEYRTQQRASPSENMGVQEDSPGSNNWVVSAAHSGNGHVVVANDPHRNVANPSIRYIVHLNAPGWNVIGATEPVLPGVMIGHSERIAWGLTIVGTDQSDVYVEELNPANRDQARFRGAWENLRIERDTIRVKDSAPVIVARRYSRHGPIFYVDTINNRAYAIRTTAHLPGAAGYVSALRYHAIQDCNEFLDAQRYYLAPTENMICGDTRGNIAWQASAASPKRPNWHGRLPVAGTGEYEWDGLRADLPRELNPPRGWVATANNDIHPPNYDPPLFFKNTPQDARVRRLREVLSSGRKFTLADHAQLQHDAYNTAGANSVSMFAGWSSSDAAVERARAALATWDGHNRRESEAAAYYRYAGPAIPNETRNRMAAERKSVLEPLLVRAIDSLRARLGPDPAQWRWGRFNTSQFPHPLVSAFDIPAVERHGGAGFVAAVGATYRQIVDMSDLDASLATNVPGQSAQPFSPFYQNLVESYGRGEYFPLAFSRAAVERVAAHRLILAPR